MSEQLLSAMLAGKVNASPPAAMATPPGVQADEATPQPETPDHYERAMTHLDRAMTHAKGKGGALSMHVKLAKHHLSKLR